MDLLRGILGPHGFRDVGGAFRRIVAPAVQVMHARFRSNRRTRGVRFTLDLGVFFPQAYAMVRSLRSRKPHRRGGRDCSCTVRCNIGALLGPAMGERWWSVAAGEETDAIRDVLVDAIDNAAVPWLDRVSDPRHAMDETSRVDAISLALMLGDLETARRLTRLAQAETASPERFLEWARSLWLVC